MLKVVEKRDEREAGEEVLLLDEIAREEARRMLMAALKAEADAYVERHRSERDEQGHALVVRNGQAKPRKLTLGAGTVELQAPRVDDRRHDEDGERRRFTSQILPPYMRRSPKVAEVLPILYLRGLATGDFRPALEALLGEDACGLSATNIARLTTCWEKEYADFRRRDLSGREYVYVWVDGVHFKIDQFSSAISIRSPAAVIRSPSERAPCVSRLIDSATLCTGPVARSIALIMTARSSDGISVASGTCAQ